MKQYGNCRHTVMTTLALPFDMEYRSTSNGIGYTRDIYASYYAAATAWAIPGVQTTGHFGWTQPTYTVDWPNLSAQAMESMLPSMRTDNSLVNMILELKDIGTITKLWSKKRSKLKNSASLNLGIQFGLLPFVSDVQALVNALASFRRRIKELQKSANKPITRHYRRSVDLFKLPSDAVLSGGGTLRCWRIARWEEPPMYTATVRYRYSLPDLELLSNSIKAMLDSLGVRPDASILWNAIPFSFVVDWFFDVGGWLQSLSTDNLDIPVHVDDFCHSIKVNYSIELHMQSKIDYPPPGGVTYYDLHKVLMRNVSHYERRRAIPSTHLNTAVQRGPLSLNKIALGASLIAANTKAELPRLPKPKWNLMIRPWISPQSRIRF